MKGQEQTPKHKNVNKREMRGQKREISKDIIECPVKKYYISF